MLKNEPFMSNQRFKKGYFLFFYEMVTLENPIDFTIWREG